MLRSIVVRLLSRRGSVVTPPRFASNRAEAIDEIIGLSEPQPETQYTSVVFTCGLRQMVALRRDARFREAFDVADLVISSSRFVAWLANRPDGTVERVSHRTLLLDLAESAANKELPVFLIGQSAEVIGRAGQELALRTEGRIDIAGSAALSADFDPEGGAADRVVDQIRRSGARICMIGLPSPMQELFAAHAVSKGLDCTLVCTGAGLDLAPGALVRQFAAAAYERVAHLGTTAVPGRR